MRQQAGARKTFDAICVGEAAWKLVGDGATGLRLRPSSGAVNIALHLCKEGMRVGLSTVLVDDANGRAAMARVAAAGVDVTGVTFTRPRAGLVVVDARGEANPLAAELEATPAFDVPPAWSSQVVVLSGLSPVVAHAAALCKAARRARRDGSVVLLDFNAALHAWAGRDARTIRMVLRKVDVARCSVADLAVLGMSADEASAALRPTATLVVGEPGGRVSAVGPFGAVVFAPPGSAHEGAAARPGAGDALTASICHELTARRDSGESVEALWERALRRGNELGRRAAALPRTP